MRSYQPPSRGHSGQIRKAIDELLTAKRPVIYTGGGVVQRECFCVINRTCTFTWLSGN